MGFTFERIFRNAQDTVLFAVCVDNGARYVSIVRWGADEEMTAEVMSFYYDDQTDRPRAFRVAADIARHMSRGRVADAQRLLVQQPQYESVYPVETLEVDGNKAGTQ